MATKYHIGKDGTPKVCPAKIQCTLTDENGDLSPHFASVEAARDYVEKSLAEELTPQSLRRSSLTAQPSFADSEDISSGIAEAPYREISREQRDSLVSRFKEVERKHKEEEKDSDKLMKLHQKVRHEWYEQSERNKKAITPSAEEVQRSEKLYREQDALSSKWYEHSRGVFRRYSKSLLEGVKETHLEGFADSKVMKEIDKSCRFMPKDLAVVINRKLKEGHHRFSAEGGEAIIGELNFRYRVNTDRPLSRESNELLSNLVKAKTRACGSAEVKTPNHVIKSEAGFLGQKITVIDESSNMRRFGSLSEALEFTRGSGVR